MLPRQPLTICVATKDNPFGFAAMVGSLLSYCYENPADVRLVVSDASAVPIIAHSQIARMIAPLELVYTHYTKGDVNRQRIDAIATNITQELPVILADDDVIFTADPYRAMALFTRNSNRFAFGVKVDTINDRGYKDFAREANCTSNHAYFVDPGGDEIRECKAMVASGSCDIGLCMGYPSTILDVYTRIHSYGTFQPPGVIDDAVAQRLGQLFPFVNPLLTADHIGNCNNNWGAQSQKKAAVDALLEALP